MNYLDRVAQEVERQLSDDDRPDERAIELYRLYALLVLVRGQHTSLENVHDAWSAWTTAEAPDHRSLVPFAELQPEQQELDRPYLEAIQRAAERVRQHLI